MEKMGIRYLVSIVCVFLANICMSQTQEVWRGIVINEQKQPVVDASVVILDSLSGRLVESTLSDETGKFRLTKVHPPAYLLVSYLGYEKYTQSLNKSISTIEVILKPDETLQLEEVVIKAQRRAITYNTDRMIYDMAANPLQKDNFMEALKYIPLVDSDGESFSILGKESTQVYINGRISQLTGQALNNYLKNLQANAIKNVEIITAPGSSFRGEGDFGIINIILKKKEDEGWMGNLYGQFWRTQKFKQYASMGFSYNKNKLSFDFTGGMGNYKDWKRNEVASLYEKQDLYVVSNTATDSKNPAGFIHLLADYRITEKQTIGMNVSTKFEKEDWSEKGRTQYSKKKQNIPDSIKGLDYGSSAKEFELAVNLNYRIAGENNRRNFFIDLDYLRKRLDNESDNMIVDLDEQGKQLLIYQHFQQIAPQHATVWSGKAQYEQQFENGFQLTAGADTYYSVVDNDNKYTHYQDGVFVTDILQSNHFQLSEWTSSFFGSGNMRWNKRFGSRIGLRAEYTSYQGKQRTLKENFRNNYFRLLPSVHFNYAPSDTHRFSYSLAYRIRRPSYQSFNPFVTYHATNSYSTGNPYLKPSGHWSSRFGYLLGGKYHFGINYMAISNLIGGATTIKEGNVIENKLQNFADQKALQISFSTHQSYGNGRGKVNFNMQYEWVSYNGKYDEIAIRYFYNSFSASANNFILLSKKHQVSLELGGKYGSKAKYGNREYPHDFNLNIKLQKDLRNWRFTLYHSSVFYLSNKQLTQKWNTSDFRDNLKIWFSSKGECNNVGLRISYRFGNTRTKPVKDRQTSNEEAKARM